MLRSALEVELSLDVRSKEKPAAAKRRRKVRKAIATCEGLLACAGDTEHLRKFPRTAHIFDAAEGAPDLKKKRGHAKKRAKQTAVTRDDLLLSQRQLEAFCGGGCVVVAEEKIDGANLGFSIDPSTGKILCQNRSHYISSGDQAQFSRLDEWVRIHRAALFMLLEPGRHVL